MRAFPVFKRTDLRFAVYTSYTSFPSVIVFWGNKGRSYTIDAPHTREEGIWHITNSSINHISQSQAEQYLGKAFIDNLPQSFPE